MAFEYVNRKNDRYFLQSGTTRSGKIQYYFGRKVTGTPVDKIPDGYEVFENPESGQVLLRKRKATQITPEEREIVADGIRRHAHIESFQIDVSGNSLVVYLPNTDANAVGELLKSIGLSHLPHVAQSAKDFMLQTSHFTKTMRFQLVNKKERLFNVERWCYRGSIDDWIFLDGPEPLAELVAQYVPKLGTDDFFELF
jgi:hypothetical protein